METTGVLCTDARRRRRAITRSVLYMKRRILEDVTEEHGTAKVADVYLRLIRK